MTLYFFLKINELPVMGFEPTILLSVMHLVGFQSMAILNELLMV